MWRKEVDELPECCDAEMQVDKEGSCMCLNCGTVIEASIDYETSERQTEEAECKI